ncbi:hypothetical protein HW130_28060 [Streptomyces sp. PKU-EA00015]|uniref:hypothetical protein n=1 Tax=Streptomyces sp. PKU-EA00015 TaxID=2748326 RepID=UPI00159FD846|nr:hypothetical protein [Streptomyces sp. PKU-EA00015]NWF30067.1 hypothetical protein [Streptomyces sp. PKU-EA00015]
MTDRISALISAFGVLCASLLLIGAVRGYQTGSSAIWIAAGALVLLIECITLVRDVRRLRAAPRGSGVD